MDDVKVVDMTCDNSDQDSTREGSYSNDGSDDLLVEI